MSKKEKKYRVEDALNATRAAVEEGIVPCGGTAYINAIRELSEFTNTMEGDEKTGAAIILMASEEPLSQIAINAGATDSVIVEKVKSSPKGVGYDAAQGEFVDMLKAGIIDPVKVTRSALQNAACVAAMILTTETAVVEKPEKKKAPAMPEGDMDY